MGASQSSAETRSVSMDNPTPSGVIDVSEEVVQRLKLGISRVKQQEKQEGKKPDTTRTVPASEPKEATPAAAPAPPAKPKPAVEPPPLSEEYSNPTPPPSKSTEAMSAFPRIEGEPIITAMEMRRQKEIELHKNDEMWRARMAQLETALNKTNTVMEKEYLAAVEEVRKRFENATGTQQLPPCQDLKAQLIACYRAYPGETLKCADEVANFTNCVAANRIKKIDGEEQTSAKGA